MPVLLYDFTDVIAFGAEHSTLGPLVAKALKMVEERWIAEGFPDRERALAVALRRDVRTIRRRVEEAIDLVAENVAENAAARVDPPAGDEADHWHVERREALVRLDVPEPQCVERWTVSPKVASVTKTSQGTSSRGAQVGSGARL